MRNGKDILPIDNLEKYYGDDLHEIICYGAALFFIPELADIKEQVSKIVEARRQECRSQLPGVKIIKTAQNPPVGFCESNIKVGDAMD